MNYDAVFKVGFLEKCTSIGIPPKHAELFLEKAAIDFGQSWNDLKSSFGGAGGPNWGQVMKNPLAQGAMGGLGGAALGGIAGGKGGALAGGALGAGASMYGKDAYNAAKNYIQPPQQASAAPILNATDAGERSKEFSGNMVDLLSLENVPLNAAAGTAALGSKIPGLTNFATKIPLVSRGLSMGAGQAAGRAAPIASLALTGLGGVQGFNNRDQMASESMDRGALGTVGHALWGGLDPLAGGRNIGAAGGLLTEGDTLKGLAGKGTFWGGPSAANTEGLNPEMVQQYLARHGQFAH